MKNRNGLIRGLRFRPREKEDEYAFTITTAPGTRATDTYIIVPQATKVDMRLRILAMGYILIVVKVKEE